MSRYRVREVMDTMEMYALPYGDTVLPITPTKIFENSKLPAAAVQLLLGSVILWGQESPIRYHHAGATFPDMHDLVYLTEQRKDAPLFITHDLVTPQRTYFRRYIRLPDSDERPGLPYHEYRVVGKNGNGVEGVHLDFVAQDPKGLLTYLEDQAHEAIRMSRNVGEDGAHLGDLRNCQVVTGSFGGDQEPVGMVGIQTVHPCPGEMSIMVRAAWSDPKDWLPTNHVE